eukprot:6307208-Amphidinium_carterae.1
MATGATMDHNPTTFATQRCGTYLKIANLALCDSMCDITDMRSQKRWICIASARAVLKEQPAARS